MVRDIYKKFENTRLLTRPDMNNIHNRKFICIVCLSLQSLRQSGRLKHLDVYKNGNYLDL